MTRHGSALDGTKASTAAPLTSKQGMTSKQEDMTSKRAKNAPQWRDMDFNIIF
jgi:hypothetical protein